MRVAIAATAVIAALYILGAIVLYFVAAGRLTSQTDGRLGDRLTAARHDPTIVVSRPDGHSSDGDPDVEPGQLPVLLWSVSSGGSVTERTPGAPNLTANVLGRLSGGDGPFTATLGSAGSYRLLSTPASTGFLVAGLSRAGDLHTEHLLLDGAIVAGPLLLLAMFGGSLIVGLRALAPVEQARRRQLEFTADASHELRTPLSVIQAEVGVALSGAPAGRSRTAEDYREALVRIESESGRLRRLVDDLLWLARFDSQPPPPSDEPVDLGTLAEVCADRFRAVGPAITVEIADGPNHISAPPEWIDRLAGVLMDNACRYAGCDGQVRVSVRAHGNRLILTVEDSGPGIPQAARARLFDRFQRAEENGPGAGLGLAIGDSIVGSTGGRWRIGDSPLGGALIEVSWRAATVSPIGRTMAHSRHRSG
ncbi:MAG TPA: HAMP domain-containing sensor histidine kinase [Streptosporangiaceae bacterium]